MKKTIVLFLSLIAVQITTVHSSDLFEGDLKEPTFGCIALGGYSMYSDSSNLMGAGIMCAAGALAGHLLNGYYKNKEGRELKRKNEELKATVKRYRDITHLRVQKGIDDGYGVKVKKPVRATKGPDGSIRPGGYIETLELPDDGAYIGD